MFEKRLIKFRADGDEPLCRVFRHRLTENLVDVRIAKSIADAHDVLRGVCGLRKAIDHPEERLFRLKLVFSSEDKFVLYVVARDIDVGSIERRLRIVDHSGFWMAHPAEGTMKLVDS